MADQTPTPTLRELIATWRKSAQTHTDHAHFRDDPYDDVGHEYQRKATLLRTCADELDAALAAQEAVPQPVIADQGYRPATEQEQEQEPLVERLAMMMFEVFNAFAPPPQQRGESLDAWGQRVKHQTVENIRAALRQVLVVATPPQREAQPVIARECLICGWDYGKMAREWFEKGWQAHVDHDYFYSEYAYLAACRLLRHE